MNTVPHDVSERTPLMMNEWMQSITKMRERPDAPRWNATVGDRLDEAVIAGLKEFSSRLAAGGKGFDRISWVRAMARRSSWIREVVGTRDLSREWDFIPVMDRTVIRDRLHELIPYDENLSGLIINPTSGTTGMPVKVPASIFSQGCYDPLVDLALSRNGVTLPSGPGTIAAIQLCFQKRTIVYNCVHSWRGGAGFAKVNLDPSAWNADGDAATWLVAMESGLITGDPVAFAEFLSMGISVKPLAFLSTSMRLEPALGAELEAKYRCPVIDWYSLNETGPIAATEAGSDGLFRILPDDIFVETADGDGHALPDGQTGRILVSGGRNPFVPLLRYDTFDSGRIEHRDGKILLALADTRKPFVFRLSGGLILNPVDIAGIMRKFPVRLHRCVLGRDGVMKVSIEGSAPNLWAAELERELGALFGNGLSFILETSIPPAAGKFEPYSTE